MKSRSRIYVTRQIPQKALDVLLEECNVSFWDSSLPVPRGELLNNVSGVDALLCMPTDKIDGDVLDKAGPTLKVIGTLSERSDHIDKKECDKRGIQVISMTSFGTEIAADLTVAVIIEAIMKGVQVEKDKEKNSNKNEIISILLAEKTVGFIGLGDTALEIGKRLRAKGLSKITYNDFEVKLEESEIGAVYETFDKVLEESDIICICCKGTNKNRELFNKDTFHKMKNSAILIDAARGHVINYSDLYEALREQQISLAAVDVREQGCIPYREQLMGLNNSVFVPYQESNRWDKRGKATASVANDIVSVMKAGTSSDIVCG